jgi:hypothetical protein
LNGANAASPKSLNFGKVAPARTFVLVERFTDLSIEINGSLMEQS